MPEISNLVLHAKCNDNAANTTVTDDSATANNGTLEGGDNTSTKSEAGKINSCFHLNGSDDYLNFADNVAYNWTNKVSFFGWFNFDVLLVGRYLFHKYLHTTNEREIFLRAADADKEKLEMAFGDPADGTLEALLVTNNDVLSAGSWMWIGFVYDSGSLAIYINNVSVPYTITSGSIPATLYQASQPIRIGANYAGVANIDGKIDDIRLYLAALTEDERNTIYNSGNGTEDNETAGSAIIWEPEFMVMNGGFDI